MGQTGEADGQTGKEGMMSRGKTKADQPEVGVRRTIKRGRGDNIHFVDEKQNTADQPIHTPLPLQETTGRCFV